MVLMHGAHQSEPFAALSPLSPVGDALDHDELREVIELTLRAAQLLLKSGAQASRVERTTHLLGTALGVNWIDLVVMQEGIVLTTSSGEEFRTRARRVATVGVNLSVVEAIATMTGQVRTGQLDTIGVRKRLTELESTSSAYSRPVIVLLVGLACASFSKLFGADWAGFFVTWLSASIAMFVRQELTRRHYNPLLMVISVAFVAGLVPGLVHRFAGLSHPEETLAASVLLLVPGVPFINAARDALRGYWLAGMARGFQGLLISLCIALGLGTALTICGVSFDPHPFGNRSTMWVQLATDAFWSGFAALGFAVLFNVPKRTLWVCMLAAALGHSFRTFVTLVNVPFLLGSLLAALVVGIFGELFARRFKAPAGLIAVPAAIPMVPGVAAFRSMSGVVLLISPQYQGQQFVLVLSEVVRNFTATGLLLGSLALGIALPSLMLKRDRPKS